MAWVGVFLLYQMQPIVMEADIVHMGLHMDKRIPSKPKGIFCEDTKINSVLFS